ncbi:MAG: carbohydrate kinase family protein [Kineosporiaceae bacterium]
MSNPVPAVTIVCVGGVVADRVVRLAAPPVPRTSNPGSVVSSPGGVARNVAENLGRLGYRPTLVSVIGDDTVGTSLVTGVRAAGVDARGVRTVPTEPTAEYLAILAPDGELVLGVAVMAVLDALGEADVDGAWPAPGAGPAGWVVLDCNPRADVLAHAIERARREGDGTHLVAVAVSAPKITRLPPDLTGIDTLFCTRDEAQAWLSGPGGRPGLSGAPDDDLVAALQGAGAARVVLTRGAGGALAADREGTVDIPGEPVSVVDVTGGGDALVAGTITGLVEGADFASAVRRGVRLATLTVAVTGAVRPDLAAVAGAAHRP